MNSVVESSKRLGERAEATIIQRVDALDPIPDTEAEHYDAVPMAAIYPSTVPMVGIAVVGAGRPVEIKTTMPRLSDGDRGRLYLRREQHENLVDDAGCYLLAVTAPHDRDPLAMKLLPAVVLGDIISSWIEPDDRADYAQISWGRIFDEEEIER